MAAKTKSKTSKKSKHAPIKAKTLPPRSRVKEADQWNLASLFATDAEWEKAFKKWEEQIPGYEKFRSKLAQSAEMLSACMQFDAAVDRAGEKLGVYAFLKTAEDQGNSDYQRMKGRYQHVATKAAEASSFIRPEIMSIPQEVMDRFLSSPELEEWRIALDRILRYRPHTLGNKEEQLLAMQGQMSEASNQIFRQLNDADLKWPSIRNEKGEMVELGHSSLSAFLHSPSRAVRKKAFHTYYTQYEAHKNSIAAALNGSVQRDVYYAKARNYPSALEGALFHDRVPMSVYDNLIASVHNNLPALYRYYDVRRRALKLKDGIHHYESIWYDWRDDGAEVTVDNRFGVVENKHHAGREPPLTPKPAYRAATTLTTQLDGFTFQQRVPLPAGEDFVLLFTRGEEVRAAVWTTSQQPHGVTFPFSSRGQVGVTGFTGEALADVAATATGVTIELTDAPKYLVPRN